MSGRGLVDEECGDVLGYFEGRGYGVEAGKGGMGDWSGTSGESEANCTGGFYGAVKDECVWPPRHEGSR
jgi:hypothetical protein